MSAYCDSSLQKSVDLDFFEMNENEPVSESFSERFISYSDDFEVLTSGSSSTSCSASTADEMTYPINVQIKSRSTIQDDDYLTDVSPLYSPVHNNKSSGKQKQSNLSSNSSTSRSLTSKRAKPVQKCDERLELARLLRQVLNTDDDCSIDSASTSQRLYSSPSLRCNSARSACKNMSMSSSKAREVERENRRLLNQLANPRRKPLYNEGHTVNKRILSSHRRRQRQNEIERQNQLILKKIESAKSSKDVSKARHDAEYKKNVQYALNCSRSKVIAGMTTRPSNQKNAPRFAWQ